MEVILFIIGLLPYLVEIYFLRYALYYKLNNFENIENNEKPFVSVHVPIYNEPPEVVIETLESLKKQNYDNYEVLVLVNNTPYEMQKPIEDYCKNEKGVLKYHYIWTKGFKGGVLNKAFNLSDKKTEIISVVDSDYKVSQNFIKEGVKYFKEDVAIVQFPQDYRDFPNSLFFWAMYLSYRYFFAVIMRMCHVLNAVAFMGTVGFIKKLAIEKSGGWSERIITEDSEAGLRIVLKGFKGVYIDKSVGKGLMPFNFFSCRKQRLRWAYGNAQTLIKHLFALTLGKELSPKQKIAFWIQNTVWHIPLIPTLILAFLTPLETSLGFLGAGLLTGFLLSRSYSFLYLFKKIDHLTFFKAFLALVFYFSLFFPMSYAPIRALWPVKLPFYRTPKSQNLKISNPVFLGEILIFFLIISLLTVSIFYKMWVGIYISLLSLIFPLSFFCVTKVFPKFENIKFWSIKHSHKLYKPLQISV